MITFDFEGLKIDSLTVIQDYNGWESQEKLKQILPLAAILNYPTFNRGLSVTEIDELEKLVHAAIACAQQKYMSQVKANHSTLGGTMHFSGIRTNKFSGKNLRQFLNIYFSELEKVIEDHNSKVEEEKLIKAATPTKKIG